MRRGNEFSFLFWNCGYSQSRIIYNGKYQDYNENINNFQTERATAAEWISGVGPFLPFTVSCQVLVFVKWLNIFFYKKWDVNCTHEKIRKSIGIISLKWYPHTNGCKRRESKVEQKEVEMKRWVVNGGRWSWREEVHWAEKLRDR